MPPCSPVRARTFLGAAAVLSGASLLSGCGAATPRPRTYADSARLAYEAALEDFDDDNCLDAEPAFRHVRREYAYSRYAALSELRIADCQFNDAKYVEAIQAYRQFVRFRPSHDEVPYARFRIVEAYVAQMPDDWLLSPPAYERDQAATHEALRQVRRFLADYPDGSRAAKARDLMRRALALLTRHELYVAEFYLDRDQLRAAVLRIEGLLSSYPGSGLEPEALILLGRTYLKLGERDDAKRAFRAIVHDFPRSGQAVQARSFLATLGG